MPPSRTSQLQMQQSSSRSIYTLYSSSKGSLLSESGTVCCGLAQRCMGVRGVARGGPDLGKCCSGCSCPVSLLSCCPVLQLSGMACGCCMVHHRKLWLTFRSNLCPARGCMLLVRCFSNSSAKGVCFWLQHRDYDPCMARFGVPCASHALTVRPLASRDQQYFALRPDIPRTHRWLRAPRKHTWHSCWGR
jgi:hypothetical protein